MEFDNGDLRAFPEVQLSKAIGIKENLEKKYQCSSFFIVGDARMKVSLDQKRIWAQNQQNTEIYSEILHDLAFEITYTVPGPSNSPPKAQGFMIYRLSRRDKIYFISEEANQESLNLWISHFRLAAIPEIGFSQYYQIPPHSPQNVHCFRVIRKSDQKLFCAKVTPGKNYKENKKLKEEIRTINKFDSPSILKVEAYFLEKNCSIIITEWIPDTLQDYIPGKDGKSFTFQQFKLFIFEVLKAVREMNFQDYGHFSLYKKNILVRENKTPAIIGFSEAVRSFYAPEIKKNSSQSDFYEEMDPRFNRPLEADSFFIGAIIYEYLTKEHPFPDQSFLFYEEANTENFILYTEMQKNPQIDKNLLHLLERLLDRRRVRRIHVANAVSHPFFKELKDEVGKVFKKTTKNMQVRQVKQRRRRQSKSPLSKSKSPISKSKSPLSKSKSLKEEEILEKKEIQIMQNLQKIKRIKRKAKKMEECWRGKFDKIKERKTYLLRKNQTSISLGQKSKEKEEQNAKQGKSNANSNSSIKANSDRSDEKLRSTMEKILWESPKSLFKGYQSLNLDDSIPMLNGSLPLYSLEKYYESNSFSKQFAEKQ